MLNEFRDFLRYESKFGVNIVLKDLFALHRLAFQNHYLGEILDFALKKDYKFTFFFSAKTLSRHRKILYRCKKEGHEIASHGYDHILYDRLSKEETDRQFRMANDSFKSYGFRPEGFRPPFLSTNKHLENTAKNHGYNYLSARQGGKKKKSILSHIPVIRPDDWYGICVLSYSFDRLMKEWKKKDGGTFLFHPWILRKQLHMIDKIAETKDLRIRNHLEDNITGVSFDVY